MADEKHIQLPEGTWNGLKLMILSSKLRRLYSTNLRDGKIDYVCGLCGEFFMFDDLFQYLTEIGFEIKILAESEDEAKKMIWTICKNNAEIWRIKGRYTAEDKKHYEIRLYKSELVYLYLVQNFNQGKKLDLKDLQGNKISVPNQHPEHNSLVKNILETKTLQLID